jgi:putative restriction endonuclease
MPEANGSRRWNREELKLAFYLYCQLPFGKLHQRNPQIVELANRMGRTPSSVAMKLSNFASLDPSITDTGRKGLAGASRLDREVWAEFNADWERLALEGAALMGDVIPAERKWGDDSPSVLEDFTGETRTTLIERRLKQGFFRRAVMSSYRGRCCMSGLDLPSLLVASHIVPWSADKANRLNPRNGLCLSAIHDRAFDQGFISVTDDLRVLVSRPLLDSGNDFTRSVFAPLHERSIEVPERFLPDLAFLAWHRRERFVGER